MCGRGVKGRGRSRDRESGTPRIRLRASQESTTMSVGRVSISVGPNRSFVRPGKLHRRRLASIGDRRDPTMKNQLECRRPAMGFHCARWRFTETRASPNKSRHRARLSLFNVAPRVSRPRVKTIKMAPLPFHCRRPGWRLRPAARGVPVAHPPRHRQRGPHRPQQEQPPGVRRLPQGRSPDRRRVLGYRPRRVPYPPCPRWWYPPRGPGCLR